MRRILLAGVAFIAGLVVGGVIGVAGKTHTVTRASRVTGARTITTHAPCRAAIADARSFALQAGRAFGIAAAFPPLVAQAAAAGGGQNVAAVNRIATALRIRSAQLDKLVVPFEQATAAFNRDAVGCK